MKVVTRRAHELAEILWDYNRIGLAPKPSDVGIALGSHDPGVAELAAQLYLKGFFPYLVLTGATTPTTIERFPRGEAVHYAETAERQGVPRHALIVEPEARNTSENFVLARQALLERKIEPATLLVVCKPYMERRAIATCGAVWPTVDVRSVSEDISFRDYLRNFDAPRQVIEFLVGDTQRVIEYGRQGLALEQDVPAPVLEALQELINLGFTDRMI